MRACETLETGALRPWTFAELWQHRNCWFRRKGGANAFRVSSAYTTLVEFATGSRADTTQLRDGYEFLVDDDSVWLPCGVWDEQSRAERDVLARHGGEPLALLSELDTAREENERLRKLASTLRDRLGRVFSDWIRDRAVSEQSESLAHSLLSETHREMGESI